MINSTKHDYTYILFVGSLKQNNPTPAITSSKMVPSFIKFNGWYYINCNKENSLL